MWHKQRLFSTSCVCVRYNQETVQTCQKDSLSLVTVVVLRPETYNTEHLLVFSMTIIVLFTARSQALLIAWERGYMNHLIFILVVLFQLTIICTNSVRVKIINVGCSTPVPSPRGT